MEEQKEQPTGATGTELSAPIKGVYGPHDKPKGQATVVPDEPVDIFPVDNGDLDNPTTTPEPSANN